MMYVFVIAFRTQVWGHCDRAGDPYERSNSIIEEVVNDLPAQPSDTFHTFGGDEPRIRGVGAGKEWIKVIHGPHAVDGSKMNSK